jgi:hypothetical protein
MNWEYRLLSYTYVTYCQGTADEGQGYALIKIPDDASFNNARSTLIQRKHIEGQYEIDIESIEDLTIKW